VTAAGRSGIRNPRHVRKKDLSRENTRRIAASAESPPPSSSVAEGTTGKA